MPCGREVQIPLPCRWGSRLKTSLPQYPKMAIYIFRRVASPTHRCSGEANSSANSTFTCPLRHTHFVTCGAPSPAILLLWERPFMLQRKS
jgi:hypothetical protein